MRSLTEAEISELIAMAWDDQTSFDTIAHQMGLREPEVKQLMRTHMKASSFRLWRKRVSGRKAKHEAKMGLSLAPNQG
jgi:uncharacterized protein (TIGR03643 family)